MPRRSLLAWLGGLLLVALAPGTARADEAFVLDGSLNGQPVRFALDTGAGVDFAIWRRAADKLALNISRPFLASQLTPGQIAPGWTEQTRVEVMGEILPNTRLAVIDTPGEIRADVDCLVGWPAMRHGILLLEAARHHASLLERLPSSMRQWTRLGLRDGEGALILRAPAKGTVTGTNILIDTGSAFGVRLSPEKWREWKAAHPSRASTMIAYFKPGSGLVVAEESWAAELDVGGIVLRDVPVMETDATDLAALGSGASASFGLAALARMELVVDGAEGIAYEHTLSGAPLNYSHNRLGAVFVPRDGQSDDLIASVAERSPAFLAGVRDGDVLQKVEDTDVTKFRTQPGILPLSRFWNRGPGTTLALELKRGGRIMHVNVRLRNLLGAD